MGFGVRGSGLGLGSGRVDGRVTVVIGIGNGRE